MYPTGVMFSNPRACRTVLLIVCTGFVVSPCFPQPTPLPDSPSPQTVKTQSFFQRWGQFYREDWRGAASPGPPPPRRGLPSPLESPPFPNSDWSYGGSPVLGEPDTNPYPLMTAWDESRSRTKVYGWVE